MKKIIMVLGVVALLAVAGISMGVANAKTGGQELVLDTKITFLFPGASNTLDKGAAEYLESVLFREGACETACPSVGGSEVIGKGRGNLVATEPNGTFGVMGTLVFTLTEGDIHVSIRTADSTAGVVEGAIIGGTGNFRGATGEYFSIRLPILGERRATFKFNSGKN